MEKFAINHVTVIENILGIFTLNITDITFIHSLLLVRCGDDGRWLRD